MSVSCLYQFLFYRIRNDAKNLQDTCDTKTKNETQRHSYFLQIVIEQYKRNYGLINIHSRQNTFEM